jgi:hypothetical protein
MARTFQQWKVWCSAKLVEIARTTRSEKTRKDAELLLTRLQYLRLESLPSFLVILYAASQDDPVFFELAPKPEEVDEWFQEEVRSRKEEEEVKEG